MPYLRFPSLTSLIIPALALLVGCAPHTAPDPAAPAAPAEARTQSQIENIPDTVLVSLNVQPNDDQGEQGRALYVLDVEAQKLHFFPFTTIEGGPIPGQPMHSLLTQDRKTAVVSMGGSPTLPLRFVVVGLDWKDGVPSAKVEQVLEMVPAGTRGNSANGSDGTKQEGHGPRITADGRYITMAELQYDRVRVYDTETRDWVGDPIVHQTIQAPHGLYLNPASTQAAIPQYNTDLNEVSIWDFDKVSGETTFNRSIPMIDGFEGSILHTIYWLDDNRFLTNATQEDGQGNNRSRQSVWLVDTRDDSVDAILGPDDLLQGVSDVTVANGKLYVAEGNNNKFLIDKNPQDAPGYLSIWDITQDVKNPTLIRRMAAGDGLPDGFANAHSLEATEDGKWVFLEAYSTSNSIQIDAKTDRVVRAYGPADGLDMSHGLYIQPQQN